VDLHHEVIGDGSDVVLLHAGIADSRMWAPQWETFPLGGGRGHRVLRCDLPGFGRTPIPPGAHHPAREVIRLLDALGIERAAFVGASMSGEIALDLALAAPERVSALVLVDAAVPGLEPSPQLLEFFAEEEAALERDDLDAAVEANVRMWVDGGGDSREVDPAVRDLVRAMQRRAFELQVAEPTADPEALVPDAGERLAEVRAPTLVIVGADDVADFHAMADRAATAIPDVRGRTTIAGAAHLPSLERPAEFDAAVLPFLAEV
jgi:pimeloyl-ACP methyl ester carboxylesterase